MAGSSEHYFAKKSASESMEKRLLLKTQCELNRENVVALSEFLNGVITVFKKAQQNPECKDQTKQPQQKPVV